MDLVSRIIMPMTSDCFGYSLSIYHRSDHWCKLIQNVNKSQFSWKDSAHEYATLCMKQLTSQIYRIREGGNFCHSLQ